METTTIRTETRTLGEWLNHQVEREHEQVRFLLRPRFARDTSQDVVLVQDGQTTWAARQGELRDALEQETTYRIRTEDGVDYVGIEGLDRVTVVAYSDLCQDVQPLAPDAEGVAKACEHYGIDPDALTS